MPRKKKSSYINSNYIQLEMNFDEIFNPDSSQILNREQINSYDRLKNHDPLEQTLEYMSKLVKAQDQWETTIQTARERLSQKDPRELYLEFFQDLREQIKHSSNQSERLANLLKQVAIRGFGMTKEEVNITPPPKGSRQWKVELNKELVQRHLETHIVGRYFLNSIESDDSLWNNGDFLIGSSDVSQHRSSVPYPARFFNRTVPFLLNNAAGAIVRVSNGKAIFDQGRFNPQPTQDLLQWMLIDPSYQDELEPEDFHRCTASAMDVGQYIFDHEYLLNADRDCPNIILRDGSLFPQDAYLDNYIIDNRRGEFTRKAIKELLKCVNSARDFNRIYCGVSKNVRLKIYSSVLDWYIAKHIDTNWETGNYSLTDGQAMTLLLSSPDCFDNGLKKAICTCLIRRSFTTRATLNEKANLKALDESYFNRYRQRIDDEKSGIDIAPYKDLCEKFHTYTFFIGHSKSPNKLLPRYEFFSANNKDIEMIAAQILTAIKYCSFAVDEDHSFMSDEAITYLIPSVTQQSHTYSKDVGKWLTQNVKHQLLSKYQSLIEKMV
ncbi:hypothetical protein PJF56_13365 [Roseofilum sp. BLCC_M91]|uniref:Uncharacterized protein n=1 Tax=Roseofilum halophilum BLCC-M91 TaxID=3022259 RepID=A0ABT7BN03_9CYAN|nr:hypothetical protein [Roseofilum halophilum]MDJ1179856.1 hypothetical protein [Roseofilum halophilum BLCC-M91]